MGWDGGSWEDGRPGGTVEGGRKLAVLLELRAGNDCRDRSGVSGNVQRNCV